MKRSPLTEEGEAGTHSRAPGAAKKRDSLPEAAEKRDSLPEPEADASSGTDTEREATKMDVYRPARPEMRGVGDDPDESVTQTHGSRSTKAVEEDEFTPKSPISMPYIPDELNDPTAYPAIFAAFKEAQVKYTEKLSRRLRLLPKLAHSCHLPIPESAKEGVLHAAKSIIRLSSSVDGKPLANCCGLLIKWDLESKTGTVLTTAHLIRSKHPTENHWEGRDEYNIKANVIVHLLDGTTADGHYLYHQEHYDLA
ncbi:uncharacterized protein LOC124662645, partial [Lolium rigidum]|uniref:uncharacterized protein LOC124662645 n=1 Tax=Lolium rigidum TaxID=89674 RepID=UPI001F5C5356